MRIATVSLGGQDIELTPAQVAEYLELQTMPGWATLQAVLGGIRDGTLRALGDLSTPLENIRALQGRLSVAADLANLSVGLSQWLETLREDTDNDEV